LLSIFYLVSDELQNDVNEVAIILILTIDLSLWIHSSYQPPPIDSRFWVEAPVSGEYVVLTPLPLQSEYRLLMSFHKFEFLNYLIAARLMTRHCTLGEEKRPLK